MKPIKCCMLLGIISGIVSQSFFAYRQPKSKNPAVVSVEQTKRAKEGKFNRLDDGEGDEPVPGKHQPEEIKRDSDSEAILDITDLLDDVLKGFAESPETWHKEELMGDVRGQVGSRGTRNKDSFYNV